MSRRAITASLALALTINAGAPTFARQTAARQAAAASPDPLRVTGDVTTPLTLTVAQLRTMPRKSVEVKDAGGTVTYEGVLVSEILKKAGAPLGAELRGNAMATYVIASAPDGYWVVFSLAELDPEMTGSEIIVADTVDGKALAAGQGPLRIVVPKDSRPARSVRMLVNLDVVQLRR